MAALCQICREIPFSRLPSETEPAYPHQPSLDALRASSQQCQLCRFILEAVNEPVTETIREPATDVNGSGTALANGASKKPLQRYRVLKAPDKEGGFATELYFGPEPPAQLSRVRIPPIEDGNVGGGRVSKLLGKGRSGKDREKQGSDVLRPWIFGNWWALEQAEQKNGISQPQLVGIGVRVSKSASIIDAEGNGGKHIRLRGSQFRIRTLDDAPAASFIPSRLRSIDCLSNICINRVREWLKTCTAVHHHPVPQATMPTRLLDVGTTHNAPQIRLVDSASLSPAPYITLSHCWGTSHWTTTTKASIASYKAAIEIQELPKTFLDAVLISRALGIRFLWIDTLCIIQDDEKDWEHEVAQMASTYSNCLLAIAASAAKDDEVGCALPIQVRQGKTHISPDAVSMHLPSYADVPPYIVERPGQEPVYLSRQTMVPLTSHEPNPQNRPSNLIITKEWMPSSSRAAPMIYKIGSFGREWDPIEEEPLSKRAWALQERLLAPRTLHFGSDQLIWECRAGMWAEDGTPFPESFLSIEKAVAKERMPWHQHGLPVSAQGMNLVEGLYHNTPRQGRWDGGWLALVQQYCRRSMSKSDDKLPAIAGLARVLAEQTGDRYLAGLWYNHLEEDLCWRVYAKEELHLIQNSNSTMPPQRQFGREFTGIGSPESYRAPSWSWASVDAGVLFVQMNFDHIVAAFEGGYIEPVGDDMFGRVKAGWIQLTAPLLPLRPLSPTASPLEPYGVPVEITCAAGIAPGSAFLDDGGDNFPSAAEPFVLFLDWGNALIVTRVDGRHEDYPGGDEDEFQKVGRTGEEWKRIGLARFIWTPEQKARMHEGGVKGPGSLSRGVQCHGPITDGDARTLVTLI